MSETEENKNRKMGLVITGAFHALLFILFLFILAWREPDPPLPEYGIELNFGTSDVGSGKIQPVTPVNDTDSEEEAAPEELSEQQEVEESEEVVPEETAKAVEESVETVDSKLESPEVIKEVKKPENKPVPVVKEEKKEVKEEPKKPVENKNTQVNEDGAKGKEGDGKEPQKANQGDNIDKEGDKGNEQGTLDARALYGNPGGGGGSSLDMAGWIWDFKPKPDDTSNENGRIVFEIKIDDQGEIISVRTLERSVSPAIEKIYRAEVEKLTFSRTSDNTIVAPISTGKITFVIKSK